MTKLSKSLKIPNFVEDNELLIRSPYTNYVRSVILTVISQPMFNLETLPPSLPILVFKYIFLLFCSWFTIFLGLKDFIWSDFWKHLNYFFKLIRVSVKLPLGFILYILGRWFTMLWGLKNEFDFTIVRYFISCPKG